MEDNEGMKKGKIALIGSGELTPSMVEVHKFLLSAQPPTKTAYFLDTPAGFQPNADDISSKAQEYFQKHVQHQVEVASFKSAAQYSPYDLQLLVKRLENAGYLLVGPGSPTYMLKQLAESVLLESFKKIVLSGGCLAIASAAALTAGTQTLPVYEIYKVGEHLHWQKGLNLLSEFHLDVVVIPHWDNGEGGTHDTRFCYMGEERFLQLREQLPSQTLYIGIDEHTVCILDFAINTVEIRGQGGITLLQGNIQQRFVKGDIFPLQLLQQGLSEGGFSSATDSIAEETLPEVSENTFWQEIHSIERIFQVALTARKYRDAAAALLDFDKQLSKAVKDFESEENISQAREIYRELIVQLSIELQATRNTIDVYLEPLIDNLLKLRGYYKKNKQWQEADEIRQALEECNIHIEDTKDSVRYRLLDEDGT